MHNISTRAEQTPTDEELFHQYRRGDDDAFARLFERRKGSLYTFCLRMMGDSDRAADAFQETFLRAVKYRQSFHPDKSFRAWLFTIARNACMAQFNDDRHHASLDDHADDAAFAVIDHSPDITERELLADALAKLPAAMREALLLYEYEGFSYQEICAMTGSGLSTVKVRIHRARKLLRAMLEPVLRRGETKS